MIVRKSFALGALHSYGDTLTPMTSPSLPTIQPNTLTPYTPVAAMTATPSVTTTAGTWTLPTDQPWSTVFDAQFYLNTNPDLQALVQQLPSTIDPNQFLFEHFNSVGRYQGRCAHPNWCSMEYIQRYPDLTAAFGTNWYKAVDHWFSNGISEGRIGKLPPGAVAGQAGTSAATAVATTVGGGAQVPLDIGCPQGYATDPNTGNCTLISTGNGTEVGSGAVTFMPPPVSTSWLSNNLPLVIGGAVLAVFLMKGART